MKVQKEGLAKEEYIRTLDALYTSAGAMKGRDAMKLFLRDLLTDSERIMLGRRITIAQMITAGKTHEEIVDVLHVGYDTIARVHRWLRDDVPGYEMALAKLREELNKREGKRAYAQMQNDPTLAGMFARLKKQYPVYFLLFPTPKKYRRK